MEWGPGEYLKWLARVPDGHSAVPSSPGTTAAAVAPSLRASLLFPLPHGLAGNRGIAQHKAFQNAERTRPYWQRVSPRANIIHDFSYISPEKPIRDVHGSRPPKLC